MLDGLLDPMRWSLTFAEMDSLWTGFALTLKVVLAGLALSLVLGTILGVFSTTCSRVLRGISRVYVEFFQNTPLILQVCFLYYALAYSGVKISVVVVGFIALGFYHGAYVAEVVRAGIQAVPCGQFDAAWAQGFGYTETMKHIILPQTVKIILPPMVNQVVALIKNTSCLFIIGGADLIATTYNFVTGESTGGAYGPAYLVGGLLFFVVCYPLSLMAGRWESRLKEREKAQVEAIEEKEATV